MTVLAEDLGHAPDAKLLIINCDDLGSSHAANVGVYEALRNGIGTSATLMVPCPWAREAASRYRGEDVGVHLTLNAEYDLYRWGPITHAPSLLDGDGGFPRTVEDVWDHADLDEVRRELRAQVERAIYWGFDVSHLDSHMGTLQLRPEFFDIYLELAVEFCLPFRLSGASTEQAIGFPFRRLAAEEGVVFPDHFIRIHGPGSRNTLERLLGDLRPGVTEVYVHPAADTPELRSLAPDWFARVDDHQLVTEDRTFRALLERVGAQLIGFRALRDLMRKRAALVPSTT
ncbi:MAG TPA: polysaccharide deacetylase family protein [Acidimicrobiales bacterium]|nr:polysaccharide deacetylase family protein [Acidimicrobiales bacterium]